MMRKLVIDILWGSVAGAYAWFFVANLGELMARPGLMMAYGAAGAVMVALMLRP